MACGFRALAAMRLPLPVEVRPRGSSKVAKWIWPLRKKFGSKASIPASSCQEMSAEWFPLIRPARVRSMWMPPWWIVTVARLPLMLRGSGTAGTRGDVVERRPRKRTDFRARAAFGAGAGFGGRARLRSRGGLGADAAFGAVAGEGWLAALGAGAECLEDGGALATGRLGWPFLLPDAV